MQASGLATIVNMCSFLGCNLRTLLFRMMWGGPKNVLSAPRKVFLWLWGEQARMPLLMNWSTKPPSPLLLLQQNSNLRGASQMLHLVACLAMSLILCGGCNNRDIIGRVGACALQVTLMGCNCYLEHNSKDVGAPPAQFSLTPMFQRCPNHFWCTFLSKKIK